MRLNTLSQSDYEYSGCNVLILFGPTAVGKTEFINSHFSTGYEIINADSIQVYKLLDIGSAKPSASTLSKIPHHLVSIIPPDSKWTVNDFITSADTLIPQIRERNNMPLISGGTAFYIKHFLFGLSNAPKSDEETRKFVAEMIERIGLKNAHIKLEEVDPVSASNINENDVYRVSRALEVYYASGKALSSFSVPTTFREGIKPYLICLRRDREELKKRIRDRVNEMFKSGLMDEINSLKSLGADLSWQSMQAIGYREFFTCQEKSVDEIKEQIILDTIHYAKRQVTFFNSFKNVHYIDLEA